jgi:type II secretory pathway predicted ATPase ExeA/septal ring-binding cell division protein DamX
MYYEHFGLTQAPFKITPNTEFFFTGGNRGPVLEALIYAITHGEGIVKVSGEVGSGKTMLCNMLQSRLPPNVESVYLAHPSVAPEEALHAIAFELGLGIDRHADRLEVMHALQQHLLQQHAAGQRVVLFIEESQSMPLATLEEIRLLSNLETRNDKLLQMVLFGQPELDEILRRPDIRQLRDRIAHSFRLDPLGDDEVREYLMFRMRAAGYRGPEIFSPTVVRQIARASSGLTRRINLIADKALLAAFSENTHTIEPRHVQAALRDSEFGQAPRQARSPRPYAWAAAALVAGTALGAVLYALVDNSFARPHAPPSPVAAATPAPTPAAASAAPGAPAVTGTPPVPATPTAAPATAGQPAPTPDAGPAVSRISPAVAAPSVTTHVTSTAAAPGSAAAPQQPEKADTPVVTPAADRTSAPSGRDIIANRVDAMNRLLKSDTAKPFSIQLLTTGNEEQLRNHLKAIAKFVEVNDIYMYRSVSQGRPAVSVLWGTFDDRQAAQDQIVDLPRPLRANKPYVRSMDDIRAEVDRNSVSR